MKRMGFLVMAVALTGLGCVSPSFLRNDPPPKVEIKTPTPPAPLVTPDSVTEKNAAERARALREDLFLAATEADDFVGVSEAHARSRLRRA